MPNRKVIGRLIPKQKDDLPGDLNSFVLKYDGYNERLGLIPAEIAPSEVQTIRTRAAQGEIGRLYELYRKMESTDSRYGGLVGSLKSTIAGMPVKIQPAEGANSNEQELADDYARVVEENLALLDTHNLVREFVDAYLMGAKVLQMRYETHRYPYNRAINMAVEVRPFSSAKLRMDMTLDSPTYGELMVRTKQKPEGEPLSAFNPLQIIHIEDGFGRGFYDAIGVARKVMGWWLTKIYAQLWWVEYAETYGQPLRIGKYPEGASPESKRVMEKFLKTLGKSAYGLFPQGMELQLQEANAAGTVTTYQDIIRMANDEMAIAVLGQVETMGDRRYGSRAKADVLNDIRYEIIQNVAMIVTKGFRQFARNVIAVNYGLDYEQRLIPKVYPLVVNPEDSKTKVETFNALAKEGTPVPIEHIYEQTGVPMPKKGQPVLIGGQIITFEGLENGLRIHPNNQDADNSNSQAPKGGRSGRAGGDSDNSRKDAQG